MAMAARLSAVDPVEALAARVQVLEREVARLRVSRGPRDSLDVALVHAIVDAAGSLPWRAGDLLCRADTCPDLRRALRAAECDSARRLGKFCARVNGHTIDDFRLEALTLRGRRHWKVVTVSSE